LALISDAFPFRGNVREGSLLAELALSDSFSFRGDVREGSLLAGLALLDAFPFRGDVCEGRLLVAFPFGCLEIAFFQLSAIANCFALDSCSTAPCFFLAPSFEQAIHM
jgi:hypothetical protein